MYQEPLYHQGDGSWAQWLNCVLATCTSLMDRVSMGFWRVAASALRTMSGDTSGGVTYGQAQAVVLKATGGQVNLVPTYGSNRAELQALVRAGHPVGISIDASVTLGTPVSTGNFAGGHTVGIQAWRNTYRDGAGVVHNVEQYLVGDPGTTRDWTWWAAALLYKAAEKRGGGVINLIVGRDTEGTTRPTRFAVKAWSGTTSGATVLGTIAAGANVYVGSTLNGSNWTFVGHTGHGWAKTTFNGKTAYVAGGALK